MIYLFVSPGPLVALLTRMFGCRVVTVSGSLIAATAIFSSSFATSINVLVVTHGIIAGR